uniref:Uncharacterized protein n=1 Tax=Ixodes ricinus TaxID=34613 RepID=A0A6B0UNS9_IXORI
MMAFTSSACFIALFRRLFLFFSPFIFRGIGADWAMSILSHGGSWSGMGALLSSFQPSSLAISLPCLVCCILTLCACSCVEANCFSDGNGTHLCSSSSFVCLGRPEMHLLASFIRVSRRAQ